MLRTENEYREALKRLAKDREVISQQKANLKELGLNSDQIERAIQPSICFHDQLKEEVEAYEKLRRGDFDPINNLTQIGSILIGTRIALDITQQELAERLSISAPVVSRDERNEYHGVTVEKAQRVLEALGVQITISIDSPLLKAA
jgi:ribosome-binding protein aMBF1 (putative translation factor)